MTYEDVTERYECGACGSEAEMTVRRYDDGSSRLVEEIDHLNASGSICSGRVTVPATARDSPASTSKSQDHYTPRLGELDW